MGIQIEDGTGGGQLAGVTANKLRTLSVNIPFTHHQTLDPHHNNLFSAIGTVTPINGTAVSLFIQSTNSNLYMCIDRITVQATAISGGTAVPNTSAYIRVGFGRTYSAGGSTVTPVNLNRSSGNTASATAYQGPTLTGTFTEAYRWYLESANSKFDIIPQGGDGIILGNTNTIEISYVSDNISGTILAVVTFFFTDSAHSAP